MCPQKEFPLQEIIVVRGLSCNVPKQATLQQGYKDHLLPTNWEGHVPVGRIRVPWNVGVGIPCFTAGSKIGSVASLHCSPKLGCEDSPRALCMGQSRLEITHLAVPKSLRGGRGAQNKLVVF